MYLFLWVNNSTSSLLLLDYFFVSLSAILLPTKSPVAAAVFSIALLQAVFIASVADFLAVSTSLFPYLFIIFWF